jgi:hypothetical protein
MASFSNAISSGAITVDTQVTLNKAYVTHVSAIGGVINVYDGTSAAGLLVAQLAAGDQVSFDSPVKCDNGIFVDWTAGTALVHYI